MIKVIAICGLVAGLLVLVSCAGDENMLGPGRFYMITADHCDNPDQYDISYEILRNRINRTNDGFKVELNLKEDITADYAVRIEICKEADGGCKPYQVMADNSFCEFVKKHAEQNFFDILKAADVEHGDCPIPAGEYKIFYGINYDDLPNEAMYGTFGAKVFLIKDNRDLICIYVYVKFEKQEDED